MQPRQHILNLLQLVVSSKHLGLVEMGTHTLLTILDLLNRKRVIPCQIIRFLAIFPRTSSDSFEIWHTCRTCLENNIRQFFFYLGQACSEIWPCEKMEK